MSEWQPIETAPKDGTTLRLNGDHDAYPLTGRWDGREWVAEPMTYRFAPTAFIPDPTHWRPLTDSRENDSQRE